MLDALGRLPARLRRARRADLLCHEGQLLAGRAARVRRGRLRLRHRLRRRTRARAGRGRRSGQDHLLRRRQDAATRCARRWRPASRCFNVESEAELDVLNAVALDDGPRARRSACASIPNVDPKTHPYISTGLKGNKFGIAHDRARRRPTGTRRRCRACRWSASIAISARRSPRPRPTWTRWSGCSTWSRRSRRPASALHHIDFGGGLGIDYNGDTPPAADALWQQLLARLDARGFGDRRADRSSRAARWSATPASA